MLQLLHNKMFRRKLFTNREQKYTSNSSEKISAKTVKLFYLVPLPVSYKYPWSKVFVLFSSNQTGYSIIHTYSMIKKKYQKTLPISKLRSIKQVYNQIINLKWWYKS